MEKRKIDIEKEAEMILNSVSEKVSVSPSPFFNNRVLAKIEQQKSQPKININWGLILKPGIAALIVFNLANYVLTANSDSIDSTESGSEVLLSEYSYSSQALAYYEDYLLED